MRSRARKTHSFTSPGSVLAEVFLKPALLTPKQLALHIRETEQVVMDLLDGNLSITPKLAIKLGGALGTSAEFWLDLQGRYDLEREAKLTTTPRRLLN